MSENDDINQYLLGQIGRSPAPKQAQEPEKKGQLRLHVESTEEQGTNRIIIKER